MRPHMLILPILTVMFANGCATVARIPGRVWNNIADFVEYKERDLQAHLELRDAERDALKAELDADRESDLALRMAELNAERAEVRQDQQYRVAALQAETQYREQEMAKNFDDTVQSRLNIDLEHSLVFSAIEVDVDKLQKVLAQKETDYAAELREYELQKKINRSIRSQEQREQQESEITQASFASMDPQCADTEYCVPDCARPPKRPQRQAPPKKPQLTPTEIPLKINVTMNVGLNNRGISKAQVQRLPQKQACMPQKGCTDCVPMCPPAASAATPNQLQPAAAQIPGLIPPYPGGAE